jgi:hypothetical protein
LYNSATSDLNGQSVECVDKKTPEAICLTILAADKFGFHSAPPVKT